jgi:hypothetical protein
MFSRRWTKKVIGRIVCDHISYFLTVIYRDHCSLARTLPSCRGEHPEKEEDMRNTMALALIAALLSGGCATAKSNWETAAFGAALADIASTGAALEGGNAKEANPIYGSNPSAEKMLALNLGVYGGIWALTRNMDEVQKQRMWRAVTVLRLVVAGWNMSQSGCACFKITF